MELFMLSPRSPNQDLISWLSQKGNFKSVNQESSDQQISGVICLIDPLPFLKESDLAITKLLFCLV